MAGPNRGGSSPRPSGVESRPVKKSAESGSGGLERPDIAKRVEKGASGSGIERKDISGRMTAGTGKSGIDRTDISRRMETPQTEKKTEAQEAKKPLGKTEIPQSKEKKAETGPKTETREAKKPQEKTDAAPEDTEKARALREISLKEYTEEELARTEEAAGRLRFTDGKGEKVTYREAADRMLTDLRGSLERLREGKKLDVTDEQLDAMVADAKKTLYSQEAESESRAINHHGIPHLYGVYERLRDTPDQVLEAAAEQIRRKNPESKATAEDVRAALIMASVYHDEGYLSETARAGVNQKGTDLLHGVDSALSFEHRHAPLYASVVDGAVLDETRQAILEHNVLERKKLEQAAEAGAVPEGGARAKALESVDPDKPANMDPNESFIRSALLLSDKVASDTEEKLPEVLRREETLRIAAKYYYAAQAEGLTGKGLTEEQKAAKDAMSADMRETMKAAIRDNPGFTEEEKAAFISSVDRDVSVDSGAFAFPLMAMVTPSDSVSFDLDEDGKTIRAHLTITVQGDDPDLDDVTEGHRMKKVKGILDDAGIPLTDKRLMPRPGTGETGESEEPAAVDVDLRWRRNLKNVKVEIRRADGTEAKPAETERVDMLKETKEKTDEIAGQAEARDRAVAAFDRLCESGGPVTDENLLEYLGAVLEDPGTGPETREEIGDICRVLSELKIEPDEERLREQAERARRLRVRSGNDIKQDYLHS